MSENRFADCATVEHVLRSLLPIEPPEVWDALEADALARIAELTQPVVDGAARERAIYAIRQWWNKPGRDDHGQLLDRIIDALGYTPAPPKLICTCGEFETIVCEEHPAPASPPVVELDADDLRGLADALEGLDNYADGLKIASRNGGWVLRIGGGDE